MLTSLIYSLSDSKLSSVGFSAAKRTPTWRRSNVADAHKKTMALQEAEAVPEPKEIHNWVVYVVGIAFCMSAIAYG